jgi:hypothetical protein
LIQIKDSPGSAGGSCPLIAGELRHWSSTRRGDDPMSDSHQPDEKVPMIQQLLDNPFLLLFLGVMIPMVVYTLWGVIDILTIPLAK